jgi:hypothetical protein
VIHVAQSADCPAKLIAQNQTECFHGKPISLWFAVLSDRRRHR